MEAAELAVERLEGNKSSKGLVCEAGVGAGERMSFEKSVCMVDTKSDD